MGYSPWGHKESGTSEQLTYLGQYLFKRAPFKEPSLARGMLVGAWSMKTIPKSLFCLSTTHSQKVSPVIREKVFRDLECVFRNTFGASLVVQWLRICLAMQGTRV